MRRRRPSAEIPAELRALLPRNKNDEASARALVALGYPALEPVLDEMVGWLKTYPSPVEGAMREFLIRLGAPAIEAVRRGLSGRTEALRYGIVAHVVSHWPAACVARLERELVGLAAGPGDGGTDLIALSLLVEHGLGDRGWLRQWAEFKLARARERCAQSERIVAALDRAGPE